MEHFVVDVYLSHKANLAHVSLYYVAECQEALETEGIVEWVSVGFVHAFISSFSVIIVSEIGDKTFFIAAIMAMKHSR